MDSTVLTCAQNATPLALPERLRLETRALHRQAERAGVMASLLEGRLDPLAYARLLHNLLAIYRALEQALERQRLHPAVAPIFNRALARSEALAADLATLHGAAGARLTDALAPAASVCVERLQSLERHEAHGLVAYAYVRYLGDLSGGQVLRRIVQRSPLLTPSVGTRFYEFGDAEQVARHLGAFRAGLARLDPRWSDFIVAEAQACFALHVRLFDELAQANAASGEP